MTLEDADCTVEEHAVRSYDAVLMGDDKTVSAQTPLLWRHRDRDPLVARVPEGTRAQVYDRNLVEDMTGSTPARACRDTSQT